MLYDTQTNNILFHAFLYISLPSLHDYGLGSRFMGCRSSFSRSSFSRHPETS